MTFAWPLRSLNVRRPFAPASLVPVFAVATALALFPAVARATCVYTNPDAPLTLPDITNKPQPGPTAVVPAQPAPGTAPGGGATVEGLGFAYYAPGDLNPHDKGRGRVGDRKIYLPDIIFPVRLKPGIARTPPGSHAFMNSQIWGYGGGGYAGKGAAGGSEYDTRNYDPMINRDDYCEVRSWSMPLCPAGTGHQGQDIRPPHGDDNKWEVQAVVDGVITLKTSNTTVVLKGGDGTEYYYLHMHPDSIPVKVGQLVKQGDLMGRISNFMNGGRDTTHHLHFQVMQSIRVNGETKRVYVPVFASLISAYRKAKGLDGAQGADGTLLIDPVHEYNAAGLLQPISPGGANVALQVAEPKFVSWPIPNVAGNDGKALPPTTVAQYFKPKDTKAVLHYAATGLPRGITIDPATGAIKGTLEPGASKRTKDGSYTVSVLADDGAGDTGQQSFVITAQISPPEVGTATRGKFYQDNGWVLVDAGAAFFNPSGLTLTYSAEGLPKGVTINPATGRIGGRLATTASQAGNNGIYTVTVTAAASTGTLRDRIVNAIEGNPLTVKDRFTITAEKQKDPNAVVPDVPLPVVALALPSVRAFDGQGITTIDVSTGFKPGGNGTGRLTYSAVSLPLALSIDPETGLIGGSMAANASKGGTDGSYTVTVIADNGSGGTAQQSFVVTARNLAPVLATPTVNKTYAEGEAVEISVGSAFNSPDPDSVTYTVRGLPSALTFDRKSGVIAGVMPDGAVKGGVDGVYTIIANADDGKGGKVTETFTITATPKPLPPVARDFLPSISATEGAAIAPVEASAGFAPAPGVSGKLQYSALALPPGLAIDAGSGQISGTVTAGAASAVPNGVYRATIAATDSKTGLSVTQPVTIAVAAQLPPERPPEPPQPEPKPEPQPQSQPQPQPEAVPPTVVAAYLPVTAIEGRAIDPLDASVAFAPSTPGASLGYTVTGLPDNLAIDPVFGRISGTVVPGAASGDNGGTYAATITATETATGLSASQTLQINVQAAPAPQQPPEPHPAAQPEPPAAQPPATDPGPANAPGSSAGPTPPSAQPPALEKTWTGWAWEFAKSAATTVKGAATTVTETVTEWWNKKK